MSATIAIGISLLVLGALGCVGSTFLFPLIARLVGPAKQKSLPPTPSAPSGISTPFSIAILIPAHNEERSLGRTLISVNAAIAAFNDGPGSDSAVITRVIVGANGCTDNTFKVAAEYSAECVEFSAQGKWKTLVALADLAANADWIVFADSGVVWPSDLLKRVASAATDRENVAYAPSYIRLDAKPIERLSWWLERQCKNLECAVGGPISLHGATIAYRGESLRRALSELNSRGENWLNDDVVVPLMLRALSPSARVVYDSLCLVSDPAEEDTESQVLASELGPNNPYINSSELELRRRQRMAKGNLQWVSSVPWTGNKTVRLLAYRRIARMMWAYWLLALGIGVATFALHAALTQGWAPISLGIISLTVTSLVICGVFFGFLGDHLRTHVDKAIQAAKASLLVPVAALTIVYSRQNGLKSLASTSWK